MLLFLPFPGWQTFVGFVTSVAVLMYVFTPLAYTALRREDPGRHRPFVLRGGPVLAPLSFAAANLLVYWAGWGVVWRLMALLGIGFVLMAISLATSARANRATLDLRHTIWIWPYLGGLTLISYLGQFGGGRAIIPFWLDIVVVIAFSLAIFAWAVASVRPTEAIQATIDEEAWLATTDPTAAASV
jgi:amino acid transporter